MRPVAAASPWARGACSRGSDSAVPVLHLSLKQLRGQRLAGPLVDSLLCGPWKGLPSSQKQIFVLPRHKRAYLSGSTSSRFHCRAEQTVLEADTWPVCSRTKSRRNHQLGVGSKTRACHCLQGEGRGGPQGLVFAISTTQHRFIECLPRPGTRPGSNG